MDLTTFGPLPGRLSSSQLPKSTTAALTSACYYPSPSDSYSSSIYSISSSSSSSIVLESLSMDISRPYHSSSSSSGGGGRGANFDKPVLPSRQSTADLIKNFIAEETAAAAAAANAATTTSETCITNTFAIFQPGKWQQHLDTCTGFVPEVAAASAAASAVESDCTTNTVNFDNYEYEDTILACSVPGDDGEQGNSNYHFLPVQVPDVGLEEEREGEDLELELDLHNLDRLLKDVVTSVVGVDDTARTASGSVRTWLPGDTASNLDTYTNIDTITTADDAIAMTRETMYKEANIVTATNTSTATTTMGTTADTRRNKATTTTTTTTATKKKKKNKKRAQKQAVPEYKKDDNYYRRRKKNNQAAKKSRQSAKHKLLEEEQARAFARKEFDTLWSTVKQYRHTIEQLRAQLLYTTSV